VAGWHDTIDVMIRLREWWGSAPGIRFGNSFVASVAQAQPEMAGGVRTRESGWLANAARGQIDRAEPFFVSPDVFEMVEAAAESFEPEPFRATDLITTTGFVLLPRSFYVTDVNGRRNGCRAFSWGPCESTGPRTDEALRMIGAAAPATGTYLLLYSDTNDPNDDGYEEMQMVREGWGTSAGYALWHISPWWFGQDAPQIDDYSDEFAAYIGARQLWTWIQSFFRLSMQQIVTANYSIPSRPYARRAKRAGRDPGILVMQLRRSSQVHHFDDDEGEGPDWQYQWLVRGHWRNQWYPSLGVHRQIWVTPHIKGPEDKPFKRPDLRAFAFSR
jgi:hypothetical protein